MSRFRRSVSGRSKLEGAANLLVDFGTLALAIVTGWLAWDTHNIARLSYEERSLERRVFLVRLCATASKEEARDGDSVIDFKPRSADGFESSDRLSKDVLVSQYLRLQADDFVRCEVFNFGSQPVLQVQLAMTATVNKRAIRIETTQFLSVQPGRGQAFWFVNNSDDTAKLFSPNRMRYQNYETGENITTAAVPRVNDSWVVRPNRPVLEYLDQRPMAPL